MRTLVIPAILILAAWSLPGASAAEPLLTDAIGDVQYVNTAAGVALPGVPAAAGDVTKAADLVALEVTEAEETLTVTLSVASLKAEPSGIESLTKLRWGREEYGVVIGYFNGGSVFGGQFSYAELVRRQGNDWEYVASLDAPTLDVEGARMSAVVPKVYLLDEMRRIPGRGDSIELLGVVSDTNIIDMDLVETRILDAMPDEEGPAVAFTLAMGDHSQGDILLTTPERVRVSNGGATTFVFTLTLQNLGETEDEYALTAADLPDGWNATLRSPVKVPAKAERVVSLLVSVPFAHEHGGYSSFNVSAHSARDPGTSARMRLGVLHTPIPQPAGHHSELFLHARDPRSGPIGPVFSTLFPFGYGWMNTQEDHSEDAAFITPFGDDDGEVVWWIPLNPSLQMGLDLDIEELGLLEGALLAGRDGAADLAAELYYYRGDSDEGESILLAESDVVEVILSQQGASPFELVMTPTPESDYVPYAPDAGMYLMISMRGTDIRDEWFNNPLKVQLETASFKLALPLLEYHDRLTGEAEAAQAIAITARGLVEKAARPGSVLTYTFDVRNDGPADTFVFDLAGNDVAHARLVPRGEIALGTGETREVTLALEIPFNANPGQEYEALLFVHARDDPSKMAIARTKTRATDVAAEAMPDESAELLAAQAREDQTPGAGLVALLAAAGVALALRRARR